MTKNGASALIVAKPGPLRDGLYALMEAMPQIGSVYAAEDVPSAPETTFKDGLALVLLDSVPGCNDVWMGVRRAKARWPQARCVLLVDNVEQHNEAEAAGADAVLLKGLPAPRLVASIVRLLPQASIL